MKALYNAALSDLSADDLVIVRCMLCDHSEALQPAALGSLPADMGNERRVALAMPGVRLSAARYISVCDGLPIRRSRSTIILEKVRSGGRPWELFNPSVKSRWRSPGNKGDDRLQRRARDRLRTARHQFGKAGRSFRIRRAGTGR